MCKIYVLITSEVFHTEKRVDMLSQTSSHCYHQFEITSSWGLNRWMKKGIERTISGAWLVIFPPDLSSSLNSLHFKRRRHFFEFSNLNTKKCENKETIKKSPNYCTGSSRSGSRTSFLIFNLFFLYLQTI